MTCIISSFRTPYVIDSVFSMGDALLPQVLLALATTAVFAFQMLVIYFLRVSELGDICEGLAISIALVSSREIIALGGFDWARRGHHNHCGMWMGLCVFCVLVLYFPWGPFEVCFSACFCFALSRLPPETLWVGPMCPGRGTHGSAAET